MMKSLISIVLFQCFSLGLFAQQMHDFTVTDQNGQSYSLYADYLNQGKAVLIKFFFSSCPPCNSSAPTVQSLYEQWGSGLGDVQFMALSTKTWDTNANAAVFKSSHNLTFPCVGNDGGAYDATLPFQMGNYGGFGGTPSYALIAPNGDVTYPLRTHQINDALEQLLGGGMQTTGVQLQTVNRKNGDPINVPGLSIILRPRNAAFPRIDLLDITNGTLNFEYPSADIPEMNNPIIEISADAPGLNDEVTPIDMVYIRRHILRLSEMTESWQLEAADCSGDNRISGQDVVFLNKVVLGREDQFATGVPSYRFFPSVIDLVPSPGNNIQLNFEVLKMGDVSP